jgi:predicted ABC-type ATPase
MPIDRVTAADTDSESIEESSAPERRPPPDEPGQIDVPSRADSRAGAAAANSLVREQVDDEPGEEEEPQLTPAAESSSDKRSAETAEDTSEGPAAAGDSRDQGGETLRTAETQDEPDAEPLDTVDIGGQGREADRQVFPGADSVELEDHRSPETAAETVTASDAPAEGDIADTGANGDDGEQLAPTDAAPQESDLSAEENPPDDGELLDADLDDTVGEAPGQAEKAVSSPDEQEVPGARDLIADDVGAARKGPIPAKDVPAIAEAADENKDLPKAPKASGTFDREVSSRRLEPLTDHEYAEHTARIESKVSDSLAHGEATDVRHTLNPERTIWDPDRAEIHQQIVDDLYSAAADVPCDGQAIVAGGLGGAGKSTTLEDHAGIDRSSYLTINPDGIKESLAKRGLVPPVEGLAPMERSALVHKESSALARALAGRAYADRKNVIWDITMSSKPSTARRIQQLREAGYANIEGIFVHIPVATSVERAQARHRHGLEDYRNGEGLGGRYVPPDVIHANADASWGSVNRRVFEELKPQFDNWKLYDNSVDGRGPVLVESSDGSERENDE